MLKKNDLIPLEIQAVTSSEGSGVGRYEGMVVFVPGAAPGDRLTVRVVKVLSSYCYGIIQEILSPGPGRIQPACPVCRRCGGCSLQHLSYQEEVRIKGQWISDALTRLGGISLPLEQMLPSPLSSGYRNKAQYPIGRGPEGVFCGFYAPRSHNIIPCGGDCLLQPPFFGEIARAVCQYIEESGKEPYDETTHRGLFRHLYLRWGEATGQVMVCLVVNGPGIPQPHLLVSRVLAACPNSSIASILLHINTGRTNVILGRETKVLFGEPYIRDVLAGVEVEISPLSFYQVNHQGAELLYRQAAELAALSPGETLLDLYCGAGTIGLSMAKDAKELIGVEIVESAVRDAQKNAARSGVQNARFLCADAGKAAAQLEAEGLHPSVVILDPPRKGCDEATLSAVVRMAPERIVMVSCNPATLARDLRRLARDGYEVRTVRGVDMFPRTVHVESVALLTRHP